VILTDGFGHCSLSGLEGNEEGLIPFVEASADGYATVIGSHIKPVSEVGFILAPLARLTVNLRARASFPEDVNVKVRLIAPMHLLPKDFIYSANQVIEFSSSDQTTELGLPAGLYEVSTSSGDPRIGQIVILQDDQHATVALDLGSVRVDAVRQEHIRTLTNEVARISRLLIAQESTLSESEAKSLKDWSARLEREIVRLKNPD
jgi:hypothetical protein